MKNEETIKQLQSLKEHCKTMADETDENRDIWKKDVQALDIAILRLKGEK